MRRFAASAANTVIRACERLFAPAGADGTYLLIFPY